jgi:hypothetical protein
LKDPDTLLKFTMPEKIIEWRREFEDHLYLYNGQSVRPLSYVIKPTAKPADKAQYPAFRAVNSSNTSLQEDIYKHAPQKDEQDKLDRARVFELINGSGPEHNHVKTHYFRPRMADEPGQNCGSTTLVRWNWRRLKLLQKNGETN